MTDKLLLAQISVDIRDLQKQMQKAGFAVDSTGKRMSQNWRSSTQSMTQSTNDFSRDVRRAIAGIALASVTTDVASLADAFTTASNKIAAAAAATDTAAVSLSVIADIARETRTEFDSTATLYARLTRATADLGATQEQVAAATTLINKGFIAGGASAQEQASAVLQLSQALQSGVLQGDELRSLRETSPIILAAIAKEFGVAEGALKKLGAEGQLVSPRIFQAVLKAGAEIEAQFVATSSTIAQSFTNVRTSAIEYVGSLNASLGVTASFAQVANGLADSFEPFADALLATVLLLGARGLGGALNKSGTDFARYASGISTRRAQLIKGQKEEIETAKQQARVAGQNYSREQANLAKLQKQRAAAQAAVNNDPASALQARNLTAARRQLAAATANLDAVNTKKNVTLAQQDAALRRVALATANLTGLEAARTPLVQRADALAQRELATTTRLTAAKTAYAFATQAASGAVAALAATQATLARAGAGVLAFFGGPLGLAFIAAAGAVAYFAGESMKAERATRSINTALGLLSEGYDQNAIDNYAAAEAAGTLTDELIRQKKAADALAALQAAERRADYIKGLEAAQEAVRKLELNIRRLEDNTGFDALPGAILNFAKTAEQEAAEIKTLKEELAQAVRLVDVLKGGLDSFTGEVPAVSTELPAAAPGGETEEDAEERLKKQKAAQEKAASEAQALVAGIQDTWRSYYEYKDEAIARELSETLAAIDSAALRDEEKLAARQQAQESYAAQQRELIADEIAQQEEAALAREAAAEEEIDLVRRVLDERDRMLGKSLSIAAREYEARREAIENEIADAGRRNEALAALAEEEIEFKRQVAAEMAALDEQSGPAAELARVQEATAAKLALLQEGYDLELVQLTEFEELRRAIIEDSEAEVQAIRAASATMLLSGAESMFGSLASLASTFAGQQSGIYKVLFAAEKASALASAYINMQVAIAKAAASAPPPFNAGPILAAKVQGAATIAGIVAQTAAGFKKGGYTGDGDPNTVAGPVHRGEYVFDARAVKRLGVQNLEALRSGRPMAGTIAAPMPRTPGRSVSFGDMNISVSGNGAAEIREELAATLAAHRRQILNDVDRGAGNMLAREIKRTTPRFERR